MNTENLKWKVARLKAQERYWTSLAKAKEQYLADLKIAQEAFKTSKTRKGRPASNDQSLI